MTDEAVARPRVAATSKDVAALAGVSQSTVSYVMSGKRSVTPETRQRVEAAMKELGYHPNAGARALRGAKAHVIALVVHLGADVEFGDSMPYIDTIIEEARKRDFDVVLSTTDEGPAGIERLAGRRVADAFVLMDIEREDPRLEAAASLGVPVVLMGRPEDAHGMDAIDFNTRRAAELLVDELAETGHRRVVVVGDSPRVEIDQMRFLQEFRDGARSRAAEHGLEFDVVGRRREGWAGIEDIADQLLKHREDKLGLIARTPQVAEWLVQLARIHGLQLGTDISLVALSTDATASMLNPAITNVSPQPRDLSRLAMRILFERIDGYSGPARLELLEPGGLIRRGSTARFN